MNEDEVWEDVTILLDIKTPTGTRTASLRCEATKELMDQLRNGEPLSVTDVRFVQ